MTLFLRSKSAEDSIGARRPWAVGLAGGSALRRWGRRHLTRENILDALKTAAWVVPLTILIWIYAEQEQSANDRVQALVSLKSPDPNKVVTLASPDNESIMLDIRGRRAMVEAVKADLSKNTPDGRLQIVVPQGYSPGEHQLATQQLVQDAPIFVNHGVSVENVAPKTIPVIVDTYKEIELPVQVPPEARDIGSAAFEPRTVRVRGPSRVLEQAQANGQAVAYADFSAIPDLDKPGPHDPVTVPVTSPLVRNEHVALLPPAAVTATLTVQQSAKELILPSVPVWVEAPQSVGDEFRVEGDLTVKDVKVSGPADQIALIQNQTYIPHATLTITREDASAGTQRSRKVRFDNGSLPPGVSVSKEDQDRTIDFRLVRKNRAD